MIDTLLLTVSSIMRNAGATFELIKELESLQPRISFDFCIEYLNSIRDSADEMLDKIKKMNNLTQKKAKKKTAKKKKKVKAKDITKKITTPKKKMAKKQIK